jgi:ABC-2 type transport system permease protein
MKALAITGNTLRRVSRDRTALFFMIILPFFIILIVGSATKNLSTAGLPVGAVVSSSGPLTSDLVRTLEHQPSIRVTRVDNLEVLRKSLRRGLYAAGIVIPRDYESRTRAGKSVDIGFVADQARPPTAARAAVASAVAKQGAVLQAADFTATHSKKSFDESLAQARKVSTVVPPIGVRTETLGRPSKNQFIMSGFEYTAPSQLILFVFITALAASGMIILNRQQGITRRMYATPTTATNIVLGETLARFAVSAMQALLVVALGAFIFGVNFGDPLAAVVLITLFVLVATSFAILAGTTFRTPEQAGSIGPPVGIAMGMLAGCMWPRFIMPPAMQHLGQLFPQSWAMDGFIKLIARGGGLADIAPQLGVLSIYVVILLPLATWRLRRSIVA